MLSKVISIPRWREGHLNETLMTYDSLYSLGFDWRCSWGVALDGSKGLFTIVLLVG